VQGLADHLIEITRIFPRNALPCDVTLMGVNLRQGVLLSALFVVTGATGCDDAGTAAGDARLADAAAVEVPPPADGPPADGPPVVPATPCQRNEDCPARFFCGTGSKTCISAVVEVAAGRQHTCSRHGDGKVRCWGLAESIRAGGAVVLGPTELPQAAGALALSAGVHLTCAVTREHQVSCWGNRSQTLQRSGDGGQALPLTQVTAVALGGTFGCALNPQGAWCWGDNQYGQLGQPQETRQSDLALLAQPGQQRFLGAGIAGLVHDGNDRLCAWGQNATKMVTTSDAVGVYTSPQCRPVGATTQLVAGDTHACLLHQSGDFTCWGERYYGALGLGGTDTADVGPPGTSTRLALPARMMAAGVSHTCVLLEGGMVTCFGRNQAGQIGPLAMSMVEEEVRQPTSVPGFWEQVIAVGSGSSAHHTCAILLSGGVQCWGTNATGQLGDGVRTIDETRRSASPVTVTF
jgi:alpha-tubulin suppressor-like RCC1 family protein